MFSYSEFYTAYERASFSNDFETTAYVNITDMEISFKDDFDEK